MKKLSLGMGVFLGVSLTLVMLAFAQESNWMIGGPDFNIKVKKIVCIELKGDIDVGWEKDIETAFKKADGDPLIIKVESDGGEVGVAIALRDCIKRCEIQYGSPVYIYSEYGFYSGAYYGMLPGNKIYVSPAGETGSIGVVYVVEQTPKQDKAGNIYHVFRSGKMKWIGAADSVTQEQVQYCQSVVNHYYSLFIQAIVLDRGKILKKMFDFEDDKKIYNYLYKICDGRSYFPYQAKELGLIDDVMYFDNLVAKIKTDWGIAPSVNVTMCEIKHSQLKAPSKKHIGYVLYQKIRDWQEIVSESE